MPHGMQWHRAHARDLQRRAREATNPRAPLNYDPDGPVTDAQIGTLRARADDTDTLLPPRRDLTQEAANDLIGYLTDVKNGRRS